MAGRAILDNRDVTGTVSAARPDLVIFDLDGTLTDSADGIVSSFRHALGQIGAAVPEGDLTSRIVGPPMHHTLATMGLGEHTTKADVLAHALAQLQPLPERVLMVGDRRHDVEGAAAQGIGAGVVGWGYGQ